MKHYLFFLISDAEGMDSTERRLNALASQGWRVVPGIVTRQGLVLLERQAEMGAIGPR